jgi:uncharacterized protein YerC
MARPLRIEFPGAVYHVTSRGNACADVFEDDADRELFLKNLGQVVKRFNSLCFPTFLKAERNRLIRLTHGKHGYTLKEISQVLGIHYTTVSKVINH